jgi:hypothetical protein
MPLRCLLLALLLLIAACGAGDDWSAPHAKPSAVGTLGAGFFDRDHPPTPEASITPRPGSWDAVHPSEGYRVVLLSTGQDALTRAVKRWAQRENASLKTVTAAAPDQFIASISRAIALRPDLIISAAYDLVAPLDVVSANHLDQQFLLIGAELAEPTQNVTAAAWAGAFSDERATRAIRAGVAAVLYGLTGIVIRLE